MSNTRTAKYPIPSGDMGLGLCHQCCQHLARLIDNDQPATGFQPSFAVVMAPLPVPNPIPTGPPIVLPLGACFLCYLGQGPASGPGNGLLVAKGTVPR